MSLFLGVVILLITVELIVQLVYVRLIIPVFECKPPIAVSFVSPNPDAELVSCVTTDGVTLRGSILRSRQQPAKGLILFCPELEGSHWSASSYALGLLEGGFDIVSFDFRGQGESDQQPGYAPLHWPTLFEVEDMRTAMKFIQSRIDLRELPLGILGVSRGAFVALIAAAESHQVKAVCCEGAYSTDSLTLHFISRWATLYLPRFLLPFLPRWHLRITSVVVRWASQLRRKRNYVVLERWLPMLKQRGVLLVAGERDSYVHPDIGRELQRRINSSTADFWLVAKAKHNRARNVGPDEYDRRLREFFLSTLAPGTMDFQV